MATAAAVDDESGKVVDNRIRTDGENDREDDTSYPTVFSVAFGVRCPSVFAVVRNLCPAKRFVCRGRNVKEVKRPLFDGQTTGRT